MAGEGAQPPAEPFGSPDSVISLYEMTCEEIGRLREYEFRIALFFVALAAGIPVLLSNQDVQKAFTGPVPAISIVAVSLSGLFGVRYLYSIHSFLSEQREIRARIEEEFGFHDPKAFDGVRLLPERYKKPLPFWSYQRLGVIVPLIVLIFFSDIAAGYLVWTLRA